MNQEFEYFSTVADPTAFTKDYLTQQRQHLNRIVDDYKNSSPAVSTGRHNPLKKNASVASYHNSARKGVNSLSSLAKSQRHDVYHGVTFIRNNTQSPNNATSYHSLPKALDESNCYEDVPQ
jgi:hypothetical protein